VVVTSFCNADASEKNEKVVVFVQGSCGLRKRWVVDFLFMML
jgi:hypothetical protein